jgi:putative protease
MKIPKILAPVGNWDMLNAAINAGADVVYLGIKNINMRDRAKNFHLQELKKVVNKCHKNNVEVYLTVNTIIYNNELKKIKQILTTAKKARIDSIIAWDFAVISLCRELNLNINLSTQASVANFEALKQYYKLGVKRFVLARECTLKQIKKITKQAKKLSKEIEIEIFAHGAMCVAVSGRCFMSQFLYGDKTSANRGKCIQPCRRSYIIKDPETHKELQLENNYVMSPKDLCTLNFIEKIIKTNVDLLKIEGRARSPEFVKIVVEAYKEALDNYAKNTLTKELKNKLLKKIKTVYNRDFSSGFYLGKPINQWTDEYGSKATKQKTFVGIVTNYYQKIKVAEIKIKAQPLKKGNNILIIGPSTGVHEQKVESMQISKGKSIETAKKGISIGLKVKKRVRPNDKVFIFEKK